MPNDRTMDQGDNDKRVAADFSLKKEKLPRHVADYDLERELGSGAYGEVWLGTNRRTGGKVAIKFYTHGGSINWDLLGKEVEKLRFLLSDRYVVQLLDVGRHAQVPFFVMEYMESGSLEDRLSRGPLSVANALEIFRQMSIGLVHAHGKGVLHCDVKPANVLLDQDGNPRLADFGQSRLASEESSALGTLFYMAPEQADLEAAPDARWDVYALGAVFYRSVTGRLPYYASELSKSLESAENLQDRLRIYRQGLRKADTLSDHRSLPGMDRPLADILETCLHRDPKRRFPNVQAVLDALEQRKARIARRPLVVLGAVGPALLLLVMAAFFWLSFRMSLERSEIALAEKVLESNRYAAKMVARSATTQMELRFQTVDTVAKDIGFQHVMMEALQHEDLLNLLKEFQALDSASPVAQKIQKEFIEHPTRKRLESYLHDLLMDEHSLPTFSWIATDAQGNQWARSAVTGSAGTPLEAMNFAGRTYFNGLPEDQPDGWRPKTAKDHVQATHLSAPFISKRMNRWLIAVSTPVFSDLPEPEFLGVLVQTIEVRDLVEFEQSPSRFPVLCDWRDSTNKGLILKHPMFEHADDPSQPSDELGDPLQYKYTASDLPIGMSATEKFLDPLARLPGGGAYTGEWFAAMEHVHLNQEPTGLLVIVQERRVTALEPISQLQSQLLNRGLLALILVVVVVLSMWAFVIVLEREGTRAGVVHFIRRALGRASLRTGESQSLGARSGEISPRGTPALQTPAPQFPAMHSLRHDPDGQAGITSPDSGATLTSKDPSNRTG